MSGSKRVSGQALADPLEVDPSIRLSARTGEELGAGYGWLRDQSARVRDQAFG